jgi:hypothetical protein
VAPRIAIIDAYCERYGLAPYVVERALEDPINLDSFWRTVAMWGLEAQHYKPKTK